MQDVVDKGLFTQKNEMMSIQDEMEKDFEGLDLQFEGMTLKEKNYIVGKRQVYAKDLEDALDKETEKE